MLLKTQKKEYVYLYIYKYTKLCMRDRQTWGQACWRESGSRGVYTLAPLPWVTLLLSFCALMSLLPPLPSLPHPPPSPYSGHTPPSPSIFSPFHHLLILRWGPAHTPKNRFHKPGGPEESLAPLVSTEKPPSPSSFARPCPGTPRPVDAHSSASHRKEEL